MSNSLLHKLRDHCAYTPIRSSDVHSRLLDGIVLIYVDVLDQLIAGQNEILRDAVERSWIRIQPPPEGFTHVEMFYLLLSSHGYSLNPTNFYWENATNKTYISLWKLLARFSIQFKDAIPLIRENMRDRSADGFSNSRGITVTNSPLNPMITTSMLGLQGYLNRVSKWNQADCAMFMDVDDACNTDDDDGERRERDPDADSSSDEKQTSTRQDGFDIRGDLDLESEEETRDFDQESEDTEDEYPSDSDGSYSSYRETAKIIRKSRLKKSTGLVTLLSESRMQSSFEARRMTFSLH